MKQIKFFLEKFRFLKPDNSVIEEAIKSILKEDFNISIDQKDVKFRPPNVFLGGISSVLKNEIMINQEKITAKLKIDLFPEFKLGSY